MTKVNVVYNKSETTKFKDVEAGQYFFEIDDYYSEGNYELLVKLRDEMQSAHMPSVNQFYDFDTYSYNAYNMSKNALDNVDEDSSCILVNEIDIVVK